MKNLANFDTKQVKGAMENYKYIAYVEVGKGILPLRYESGEWECEWKAKDEINGILSAHLPAGVYKISMNLIMKSRL